MQKVVRYASNQHFRIGFCGEKLLKQPPEPAKLYNFAIRHARDRSMKPVSAVSAHISFLHLLDVY